MAIGEPWSVAIARAEDMLVLDIEFYHLKLDAAGKRLVLVSTDASGMISLSVPPQHISEYAKDSPDSNAPPTPLPFHYRVSNGSSIHFTVPTSFQGCDYTLAAILELCSRLENTALINLPTQLFLRTSSPLHGGAWSHSSAPARSDVGRTELWHTRLGGASLVADSASADIAAAAESLCQPSADDVKQIAEYSLKIPIAIDRLMLGALGGWMTARGDWDSIPGDHLTHWHQRVTMGRDQYVMTVTNGHLAPTGHRGILTVVTERRIVQRFYYPAAELLTTATLWIPEPVLTYPSFHQLPFKSIEIKQRQVACDPKPNPWVTLNGQPITFDLLAVDQKDRSIPLQAQLQFVTSPPADTYSFAAGGKRIAFAPADGEGTSYETRSLTLKTRNLAGEPPFSPYVTEAQIAVEAVRHIVGGDGSATVTWDPSYANSGFSTSANPSALLFRLRNDVVASFGKQTDRAGGFLSPDATINSLARDFGAVAANPSGKFDLDKLLGGAKLFGVFPLTAILNLLNLSDPPRLITEALTTFDQIRSLADRIQSLAGANPTLAALGNILSENTPDPSKLLRAVAAAQQLQLSSVSPGIDRLLKRESIDLQAALADIANMGDVLGTLIQAWKKGEELARNLSARMDFTPPLKPAVASISSVNFAFTPTPQTGKLLLSINVRGKATAGQPAGADVLCSLENFSLAFGCGSAPPTGDGDSLLTLHFNKLLFHSAPGHKPDLDVSFGGLSFGRSLSFVQALRDLIPLDGFSDPPALTVDGSGITASYSLCIPNVSIGVFSLENIKLASALHIPFIGGSPQFTFDFCTPDHPFHLTVYIFGGGGWFNFTLGTDGIGVDAGLEFGAAFSVDFTVAGGSVSAMAGMRFDMQTGSDSDVTISGYFHLHGQLDVLDLITVSIDVVLTLGYDFTTHKVIGRATLSIEVDVAFFSTTVSIPIEKRFGGSDGDPSMAQQVSKDDWLNYWKAFA